MRGGVTPAAESAIGSCAGVERGGGLRLCKALFCRLTSSCCDSDWLTSRGRMAASICSSKYQIRKLHLQHCCLFHHSGEPHSYSHKVLQMEVTFCSMWLTLLYA